MKNYVPAVCKLSFIMDQYGFKSELPDNCLWKSPNKTCETLWDRRKSPYMALWKLGTFMDPYSWKSELSENL
jgi:hypothetical protein